MIDIMRLFAIPKDIYSAKSELVNKAENYRGVAISLSDEIGEDLQLAVPQSANDLLMLEGIEASIVAVLAGDTVRISARSLGQMNVQVMMEYLGGGGHMTMAGAQLHDVTLEEAKAKICECIDNYRSKQEKN